MRSPRILILTLNPGVDRAIYLDTPARLGGMNRVARTVVNQGSKGGNQATVLCNLGLKPAYLSFTGGDLGRRMEEELRSRGVEGTYIPTACGVRLNVKIIDSEGGCTEFNEKGGPVSEDELQQLFHRLDATDFDVLSLCGSIPQGVEKSVYKQILSRVSERKIYTVLDCDGEALEKGITARPGLIKPNRRELAGLLGLEEQDLQKESDLCDACAKLYENYGCSVICTLDSHGSVYIGDGGNFRVGIVPVPLRGFVGAGDTFLSSFLFARCAEERELPDALRFAAAAASAKVALEGTVLPTRAEIDALYSPAIPVDRI